VDALLQNVLAGFGGAIFLGLLYRAFFAQKKTEEPLRFERLDIAVAFAISALFAFLAYGLFATPQGAFNEKDIVGSLIGQGVFGVAVIGYVYFRKISLIDFLGLRHGTWWKNITWGLGLMLGLLAFISLVANINNPEQNEAQEAVKFFQTTESLRSRLLLAFMAVVVAPVVEEMVFRGLLYRIFRGYFGKLSAMFFTSVLFAAIHGNVPSLVPLTLLAMAFAAALEWSGSLLVNIAMHATFNALSLLFILYSHTP
jgi:membrane protease YdiL (CAAX protease family)